MVAKWGDERETDKLYFLVDENQKRLSFDEVYAARQTLWSNRFNSDNQFPQTVKDAIRDGTLNIEIATVTLENEIQFTHDPSSHLPTISHREVINLWDTFGDIAEDALRLIMIFSFNQFGLRSYLAESEFDWCARVNIWQMTDTSPNIFRDSYVDENKLIRSPNRVTDPFYINLEFSYPHTLIQFISRCVKDKVVYDTRKAKDGNVMAELIKVLRASALDPN